MKKFALTSSLLITCSLVAMGSYAERDDMPARNWDHSMHRITEQHATDTGFIRNDTVTAKDGRVATRETIATINKETGETTRQITYTDFDGKVSSKTITGNHSHRKGKHKGKHK
ncbi:MAG: hypothetical protein WCY88_04250, partial [Spongiibacteraceae bacterium]